MKRELIIPSFCLFACICCKDFPDPEISRIEDYTFIQYGQDQKTYAGEYLQDSIVVTIVNSRDYSPVPGMDIEFEVTQGNGMIDQSSVITDANGMAFTYWKVGNNEQEVKARIYNKDGKLLGTVPFIATGFVQNDWTMISKPSDLDITDILSDTIDHFTLALNRNGLCRQGDRFFDWLPVPAFPYSSAREIKMGSDQVIYLSNWNGQIYKSPDQGITWSECARPWHDFTGVFNMEITSDNHLWASADYRPLRCSTDGGKTWETDSTGIRSRDIMTDIYRLSDGTLFMLTSNSNLYKSLNDGNTWIPMNAPLFSLKLYVTAKDEIILVNQDAGRSLYKSTDKGEHFTLKRSVNPAYGGYMNHTFYKRGQDYYILIPAYGILHTLDFESYNVYWYSSDCNDLFLDDSGNFIVSSSTAKLYYRQS